MEYRFISKTVVYDYAGGPAPLTPGDDGWKIATAPEISAAFSDDPIRKLRFQKYIEARHTGLVLMRGGRWISYGWCSTPQSPAPPHLPRSVGTLGAHWIFGCHTYSAFRRQGIYKELLARLVAVARTLQPSAKIYIDTHPENVASRRAILASGFKPCGVFATFRVWAPLVGSQVVGGRWRKDEPHPMLAYDLPPVPAEVIATGASLKNSAG